MVTTRQIMTALRATWLDAVCLLAIALVATWAGWSHISSVDDTRIIQETRTLPIPILSSAIHFALGRGLGVTHDSEEGFPELHAFLFSEITAIPRSAYPGSDVRYSTEGHFFNMHKYLILYLGLMFRLLGVSVWSFKVACVSLHLLSMAALFGLFRLVLGRTFSVFCCVATALSPAYLLMLPVLRDFGKVPFILCALLLMGVFIKHELRPRTLLPLSALLGSVIGIGYGFRQDVFVCLPPALVCLLFGVRIRVAQSWRSRVGACVLLYASYAFFASPVIRADREVGGAITVHTLFQGLMVCSETNAAFGSVDYDFGFLNFDHPVIARIRAYAKNTGDIYPVYDLTPEYGEVGKRMFLEHLLLFPADFAARALAVVDHLFSIPMDRYIVAEMNIAATEDAHNESILASLSAFLNHFYRPLGALGIVLGMATLALVAAVSTRYFLSVVILAAYFGAYPSTLFEFRHYFFLAFLPCFSAAVFLSLLFRRLTSWLHFRRQGNSDGGIRHELGALGSGALCVAVLMAGVGLTLFGVRLYQQQRFVNVLRAYHSLELTPLPLDPVLQQDTVRLLMPQPIKDILGMASLPEYDIAAAYVAIKFANVHRTVSFELLNENPVLARPCRVHVRGGGTYFFPVYDFHADPAFAFLGIEISREEYPYIEEVCLVNDPSKMRIWPFVYVPHNPDDAIAHKTGRLDRLARIACVELRSMFGLLPEAAVSAYIKSIPRDAYPVALVERALIHAGRIPDMEHNYTLWRCIGAYVPERRREACRWMAEYADSLNGKGQHEAAIIWLYRALELHPRESAYLTRIAASHEAMGNHDKAVDVIKKVMRINPDSPGMAFRLAELLEHTTRDKEIADYWRTMTSEHPDSFACWWQLGLVLEHDHDIIGALTALSRANEIKPDDPSVLFKLAKMHTLSGNLDEAAVLLQTLVEQDREHQQHWDAMIYQETSQAMDLEDFHTALHWLRVAIIADPNGMPHYMRLAQLQGHMEDVQSAMDTYRQALMRNSHHYPAAIQLDILYQEQQGKYFSEKVLEEALHFWKTLAIAHPYSALPHIFLGITQEHAGELEAARRAYTVALKHEEQCPAALYRLGALDILEGQIDSGIAAMRRAAEIADNLAPAIARRCDDLAEHFAGQRNYPSAILLCETALDISPNDLWPRVRLAGIYESLGDMENVLAEYRQILHVAPESPITAKRFNELLELYVNKKDEVLNEWKSLNIVHPESPLVWLYLGIAHESMANWPEAEHAYSLSLFYRPDYPQALYRLGAIKMRQERFESGTPMMERAAALAPELKEEIARQCESVAEHYAGKQRYDLALTLYEIAQDISPDDLWLRVRMGEMFEILGDKECAMAQYCTVLMEAPESPVSANRLDTLLRYWLQDTNRAADTWSAIVEAHPQANVPRYYLRKHRDN